MRNERRKWTLRGELELLTGGRGALPPRIVVESGPLLIDFKPLKNTSAFIHYTEPIEVIEIKDGDVLVTKEAFEEMQRKSTFWGRR